MRRIDEYTFRKIHFSNKKVLLRKSKRHTDRRVASPGGGVDRQNHRRTDTCENITFPHPSDAVGKNGWNENYLMVAIT